MEGEKKKMRVKLGRGIEEREWEKENEMKIEKIRCI
jgi:hypothetical protein